MKDYFILQLTMANRKMKEAGMNPAVCYFLMLVLFILFGEYIFQKTEFAKYLAIFTCMSLQIQLSEKNRTEFLLSTFGDKTKNKLRIIENLIICIPFFIILIYKNQFLEASILLLVSIVFAFLKLQDVLNITLSTPFSKNLFEFSVGFRKTFFIFPIAYILTIIAIKVDNLNLGIFSFLLLFLTTMGFYSKPENEYYVWIYKSNAMQFLKNKLLSASKNVTLLVSPIIITLLLYFTSEFQLVLIFFIAGMLFQWTIILAKYSVYPQEMNLIEGIIIALSFYFPPLLLAIIPFFYKKSIKKLKVILND
jgi:hypothetical protein